MRAVDPHVTQIAAQSPRWNPRRIRAWCEMLRCVEHDRGNFRAALGRAHLLPKFKALQLLPITDAKQPRVIRSAGNAPVRSRDPQFLYRRAEHGGGPEPDLPVSLRRAPDGLERARLRAGPVLQDASIRQVAAFAESVRPKTDSRSRTRREHAVPDAPGERR